VLRGYNGRDNKSGSTTPSLPPTHSKPYAVLTEALSSPYHSYPPSPAAPHATPCPLPLPPHHPLAHSHPRRPSAPQNSGPQSASRPAHQKESPQRYAPQSEHGRVVGWGAGSSAWGGRRASSPLWRAWFASCVLTRPRGPRRSIPVVSVRV
jgi:hypothetical protein